MKATIMTLAIVLMVMVSASLSYGDAVVGRWATLAPCINDMQVNANHTIHQWQACYEDPCYTINEYDGTWQKMSKGLYQVVIQGRVIYVIAKGKTATDTDNGTWYKNISLNALKSIIEGMQCP